jgi:hypothetical protein
MIMHIGGIYHNTHSTAVDPVRPVPLVYGRRHFVPNAPARPAPARSFPAGENGPPDGPDAIDAPGATDATGLVLPPEQAREALAAFEREQPARAAEQAYREAGRAYREFFAAARIPSAGLVAGVKAGGGDAAGMAAYTRVVAPAQGGGLSFAV